MAQLTGEHQAYFDLIQDAWAAYRGALHDALKVQDNPGLFSFAETQAAEDAYTAAAGALDSRLASFPGGPLASFSKLNDLPNLSRWRVG